MDSKLIGRWQVQKILWWEGKTSEETTGDLYQFYEDGTGITSSYYQGKWMAPVKIEVKEIDGAHVVTGQIKEYTIENITETSIEICKGHARTINRYYLTKLPDKK